MNFAIRYLTEYRYAEPVTDNLNALRVQPATTSTSASTTSACASSRRRACTSTSTTSARGDRVRHLQAARPADDRRPRPRRTDDAARRRRRPAGRACRARDYPEAGGEYLLPFGAEPDSGRVDELVGLSRADTPAATLRALSELIPDRFEYRAGRHLRRLDRRGPARGRRRRLPGLRAPRARAAAPPRDRGALRLRLPVRAAPDDEAADSAEVDTHAWIEALIPAADGGEPVWVGADPTNRGLVGERHVKIGHGRHYADVPPIKGVYRGGASAELDASVRMTRTDTASRTAPAAG